jgi:hypothetical protein
VLVILCWLFSLSRICATRRAALAEVRLTLPRRALWLPHAGLILHHPFVVPGPPPATFPPLHTLGHFPRSPLGTGANGYTTPVNSDTMDITPACEHTPTKVSLLRTLRATGFAA